MFIKPVQQFQALCLASSFNREVVEILEKRGWQFTFLTSTNAIVAYIINFKESSNITIPDVILLGGVLADGTRLLNVPFHVQSLSAIVKKPALPFAENPDTNRELWEGLSSQHIACISKNIAGDNPHGEITGADSVKYLTNLEQAIKPPTSRRKRI